MYKAKESAPSEIEYPQGNWRIQISRGGEWVDIGYLNLVENIQSPKPYVAAMLFTTDKQFVGDLAGLPFPVEVQEYESKTGYIRFQILAAATLFKPDTTYPYRFFFEGTCRPGSLGEGPATIPKDFGGRSGLPNEDGDNVTWRSGGPGKPEDSLKKAM